MTLYACNNVSLSARRLKLDEATKVTRGVFHKS